MPVRTVAGETAAGASQTAAAAWIAAAAPAGEGATIAVPPKKAR